MDENVAVYKFLYEAYEQYRKNVLNGKMTYERFVSLFLDDNDIRLPEETEREKRHRMNHARELLKNRPRVAIYFFSLKDLVMEDMKEVVDVINNTKKGTHFSEIRRNGKAAKTECQIAMDHAQLEKVSAFANKHKIFKEKITPENLTGFFSEKAVPLHANKNTYAVIFLDALVNAGLIIGLVPREIERKGNLISSTGKGPMDSHAFSSALNKSRGKPILDEWRKEMIKIAKKSKPDD